MAQSAQLGTWKIRTRRKNTRMIASVPNLPNVQDFVVGVIGVLRES